MTASRRPDRREFLKKTLSAGFAFGAGPLLAGCGGGSAESAASSSPSREARTYFFDMSNADPETDFYLVSGSRHHPLVRATDADISKARAAITGLSGVAQSSITHLGEALDLPAKLHMCYIKGVSRTGKHQAGQWDMHSMFYHVPHGASMLAVSKAASCGKVVSSLRADFAACPKTLAATVAGSTQSPIASLAQNNASCVDAGYDGFKDYFDHAMALICHHPEIGSFDAPTLAYVQQNIVCADINVLNLAVALYQQGPATLTGGWATLVPYVDPDNGQQQRASNGDLQYITQHSAKTLKLVGLAIQSIMPKVKNDPMLGANITGLDKTTANADLQGKMWVTQNGTPTRLPSMPASVSAVSRIRTAMLSTLGAAPTGITWTARDLSSGNGFNVNSVSGSGTRTVSFKVSNWYLRYLGIYIRYLDGAGHPIARSALPQSIQHQFIDGISGTYDCFLSLVNQELVILGIPVRQDSQSFNVDVPDQAASIQILAGGLGHGTNSYPDTVSAGAVMTAVLDLAIPGLFLAMAAVAGYASLSTKLSAASELLIQTAKIFIQAIADSALEGTYNDPAVFLNLVMPIGFTLVKKAPAMYAAILESMEEGEAEGAALDCIPFGIGLLMQAIMALAVAAQIAETSAEIANAPWTFVTQVDATHDLTVTISHDPLDPAGFPATATSYSLLAVCDGASPAQSGVIAMQATTRTAPLAYTFNGLPAGGKVTVTTSFYSDNGYLVGAGTSGSVDNALDTAAITIKEILIPLIASTRYGHKQKTGLDSGDKHVWIASTAPPVAPLNCDNSSGGLCVLQSIAVSETFANVGYVWQSSSADTTAFGNGAAGQLYQFANVSFTEDPESGWMYSGQGFTSAPRMAYSRSSPVSQNFYIDTSQNGRAIVRRINMPGVSLPPTFDSPSSNLAVGRFNFASDAFLIHPTGKLISINSALGKLEVLVPSASPVSDSNAPLAVALSGPGTREGLLNGPACAVVTPDGHILVLEQAGNRIQAFDTGANPAPYFAGQSTMALKAQTGNITYLDVAIEFKGYLYVLSVNASTNVYSLDIYTPAGELLATTTGINASKLAIDLFRNVYTLNFETIQPVGARTEPSISQWIPSTP